MHIRAVNVPIALHLHGRGSESAAWDGAETRSHTPGLVLSGEVSLPHGSVPIVSPCPRGARGERNCRQLGQLSRGPYGKFGSDVIAAEGL